MIRDFFLSLFAWSGALLVAMISFMLFVVTPVFMADPFAIMMTFVASIVLCIMVMVLSVQRLLRISKVST